VVKKCEQSIVLVVVTLSSLLFGCDNKSQNSTAVTEATGELALAAATDTDSTSPASLTSSSAVEHMGNEAVGLGPNLGAALAAETSIPLPTVEPTPEFTPVVPAVGQVGDDEFCEGFISTAESVAIPYISKPGYMDAYIDPAFGSRVVKITESAMGEVHKPAYSTVQAWNADESYLLLYRTGVATSGHILLDGHSYEFKQSLAITPSDIEQVFWSHSDPDIFYYISKRSKDFGKLLQFNISTNGSTELADFSAYCGAGLPGSGGDVQMQSINDDLFGFNCQQDDGHHIMFSFQPSTGTVITAPIGMGSNWTEFSAPVPAPSGNRFWHQGFVIDNDLRTTVHRLDMASSLEHASIGMAADRSDAYYQVGFDSSPNSCDGDLYKGVGHLIEHNMNNGTCRNIISEEQGYPYTTSGTHISAQAYLRPERVAVSSIGKKVQLDYFSNEVAAPALLSEVYVAQTTLGDTKVCRLAHHRSFGKSAVNGGYEAYFGEPHATISPSGTRVVFGSDWYDSGAVDSYVIELQDYKSP